MQVNDITDNITGIITAALIACFGWIWTKVHRADETSKENKRALAELKKDFHDVPKTMAVMVERIENMRTSVNSLEHTVMKKLDK